jgi:hypothetical protein
LTTNEHERPEGAATRDQPSEEEMRATYEAELNRITSAEMILQTAVSLLNIGGRRLGLTAAGGSSPTGMERDLEQVRDAIDGVRALLPILERRVPRELGPLRDAIAQLQMAYAREARGIGDAQPGAGQPSATASPEPVGGAEGSKPAASSRPGGGADGSDKGERPPAPGPAESSGRLWVPGR